MPVEAEADEIDAAERKLFVERALLRDVADPRLVDDHAAGRWADEAEQHAEQRRLAGAVRAEHREQLARLEAERELFPERSVADAQGESVDGRDRVAPHRPRARPSARAWASCQRWNDSPGGSVSETATTGMPAACAAALMRTVTGETVWSL